MKLNAMQQMIVRGQVTDLDDVIALKPTGDVTFVRLILLKRG